MSLGKAIVPLLGVAAAVGLVLLRGGKAEAKNVELDPHGDKDDITPPTLPTNEPVAPDNDGGYVPPQQDAPDVAPNVPGFPTDSNPSGPPATNIPQPPAGSPPGAGYVAQVNAYYAAWKRGEKVPPYLVNEFKKRAAAESGKKPSKPAKKPPVVLAPKQLAQSAVSTVRGYIVLHGKPPETPVAQVKAFQQSVRLVDGSKIRAMKPDGIWGPLTRAAAAETLGVVESTLPLYAAKFAPKAKPAKVPSGKPAPIVTKPAVVVAPAQKKEIQDADQVTQRPVADGRGLDAPLKSDAARRAQYEQDQKALAAKQLPAANTTSSARAAALKASAQSASDAVRGYIVMNGAPPTVAVAQVRTFQTVLADSSVKPDGLWGPMTRTAAAKALDVPADGNLPPYAAAFAPKGSTALAFPKRTPVQAANDLFSYLTKTNTIASTWGTKAKPNETVRRAQADMGGLVADGVYGALTRARGKAVNGQPFPARTF